MKKLIGLLALVLFSTPLFAATGFDYPTPTTLRLFNDGSPLAYCLDTTSGIQVENCGNDWGKIEWAVVIQRGSAPKARYFLGNAPITYRVSSDNATYANVTFNRTIIGGHPFSISYNLSKDDKKLSITPNFTAGSLLPSNSYVWFEWHYKNLRINSTNESDVVWYNDARYDLNTSSTTNLGNSSPAHSIAIVDEVDEKVIYLNWPNGRNVSLNIQPQPNWPNRQLNLSFFLGMAYAKNSYSIPFTWWDADPACSDGSVPDVSCSLNTTTNITTERMVDFELDLTKEDASVQCSVYNRHQQGTTQFTTYTANYPTGITTRSVGKGTDSSQVSTALLFHFKPTIGGRNGTATFRINSASAFCTDYVFSVWDVVPPHNSTINTTNFTNYTNSNIRVFTFGADNSHIISQELYSNVSGTWQLTSFINSTASRVNNRSYGFNFSVAAGDGCYIFGAGIRDSGNNLNMSKNYTFCKNTTVAPTANAPRPSIQYTVPNWRKYELEPETKLAGFDNWYYLLAICLGVCLAGLLLGRKRKSRPTVQSEMSHSAQNN